MDFFDSMEIKRFKMAFVVTVKSDAGFMKVKNGMLNFKNGRLCKNLCLKSIIDLKLC